jgi:transposase
MFGLSTQQRYFLFPHVVDMRKSFDGLSGIVTQQMGRDVCSGDVFIFLGKDLSKIKLLVWESSGFVLYYKRLEAGTFALPAPRQESITLTYSELCLLVEGRGSADHKPAQTFSPICSRDPDNCSTNGGSPTDERERMITHWRFLSGRLTCPYG